MKTVILKICIIIPLSIHHIVLSLLFSPRDALALFRTKKTKFAHKIYFHETHTNAGRG